MNRPCISALTVALLLTSMWASPVPAHHSTAMFERSEVTSITGTIRFFSWANPHVRVEIVEEKDGVAGAMWNIEGPTPNALIPVGWKRTTLKPGDKVTLKINPMKSGSNAGLLVGAILSDGTVLTDGSRRAAAQ